MVTLPFRPKKLYTHASFVRHPFERVVSCYKNKILGEGKRASEFVINLATGTQRKKSVDFSKFVDALIAGKIRGNCDKVNR